MSDMREMGEKAGHPHRPTGDIRPVWLTKDDAQTNAPSAADLGALAATSSTPDRTCDWKFPGLFAMALALAFCILNALSVFNHVMWRDEWAVWQVGRNPSIASVYATMSHTGHPILWYLCGWVFAHIGTYPWGLKVFHILISTTSIYVFARYAPFNRMEKFLFSFGYLPFYEYGTIMRDYALELLGIVLVATCFNLKPRRPILFGVALAFLAQTTLYGCIFALTLGAAYLFDIRRRRVESSDNTSLRSLALGAGIAFASVIATYLHIRPTGAHPQPVRAGSFALWLRDGVGYIWSGYFPIPFNSTWNSNLLDPWPRVKLTFAICAIIAAGFLFARRATALFVFVLGTVALIGFSLIYTSETARYYGHAFLMLLVCFWISRNQWSEVKTLRPRNIFEKPLLAWDLCQPNVLVTVLAVHVFVGVSMTLREQIIPLSGSREAAQIIKQKAPPNTPIIGDVDWVTTPVSGYLDRPFYNPNRREYNTYAIEDWKRQWGPVSTIALMNAVREVMSSKKSDVVLVLNYPLHISGDGVELIGTVTNSVNQDETYQIFLLHRNKIFPE
jgi:hypothetical protein